MDNQNKWENNDFTTPNNSRNFAEPSASDDFHATSQTSEPFAVQDTEVADTPRIPTPEIPELDPIYQNHGNPSFESTPSQVSNYASPTFEARSETNAFHQAPYFQGQPVPDKVNPSYQEVKAKRQKKGKSGRFVAALLAICLAMYGTYSLGSYQAEQRIDSRLSQLEADLATSQQRGISTLPTPTEKANEKIVASPAITAPSGSAISPVVTIAEQVVPSVVTITSMVTATSTNPFFGGQSQTYRESGSGVIYKIVNGDVYIITNHHVIENGSSIQVTFYNEETVSAEVMGYNSRNDLAVLKVKLSDLTDQNLTVAQFGDSSALKVGQLAVAIGNPLGEGHDHTITAGIISSVNRTLDIQNIKDLEVIQTDAAINPGNSGGALVNENSQVIGINTAKYLDVKVEGMGFAIPSNIVLNVVENILKNGSGDSAYALSDERPFLGIGLADINSEIYKKTGVPFGIYITKVYENSAAHSAGIKEGDILFSIDGTRIKDSNMLFDTISKLEVGQTVKIGIVRDDKVWEVETVITSFGEVNSKNNGELKRNR